MRVLRMGESKRSMSTDPESENMIVSALSLWKGQLLISLTYLYPVITTQTDLFTLSTPVLHPFHNHLEFR